MTDCVFCGIVAGVIPAAIVGRTDEVLAIRDLDPKAPVHVLVMPTKHVAAVRDATGQDGEQLVGRVFAFAAEVATELALDTGGYRLVTNTGPDGGQSVPHFHVHILGGRRMAWPPG